jgi:hypothetical protein
MRPQRQAAFDLNLVVLLHFSFETLRKGCEAENPLNHAES